jgi:hypothetical protein
LIVRRSFTIIPLLIGLAILASAMPATARTPIAIGVSNPAGGGPNVAEVQATVGAHIAQVGTKPHLWTLWSKWGSRDGSLQCEKGKGSCSFPSEAAAWLHSQGIDPVVWWVPTWPGNWEAGKYERYKRILNGKHDAYIRQWARDARAEGVSSGRPTMVRFAHEADGHWFPWSVGRFDNTKLRFKKAWRYIWRIFKEEGALPHVRFMWGPLRPTRDTYPGDKYVDYVSYTILNKGKSEWRSMAKVLKAKNRIMRRARITKPVIVAELASFYKGGDKAAWLRNGYNKAYADLPKIKGIMYLDVDLSDGGGKGDWRLIKPNDGSALKAYRSIAAKARYKGRIK